MTSKKNTRRALFMSITSLILCCAMLMGTTFAWFTDSVTSGNNIIKSGNLDVEMYYADGTLAVPANDSSDWKDASKGAIFDYDQWEPGYTVVRHIKIVNKGTLDLKYQLQIQANGNVSELADVIDVYYTDPAVQVENRTDLPADKKLGTLTDVLKGISTTANGTLKEQGETVTLTLALKMQESAGNEYQNLAIGSDFSVILLATQLTSENDSFGNDYDISATYPIVSRPAVLPGANTENPEDAKDITLETAEETPVAIVVPKEIIKELPEEVTQITLVHTEPKVDTDAKTVTFDAIDIVDQDGKVVELSELTTSAELTITLPVGEAFAEGDVVTIYHDGEVVGNATVANGNIVYHVSHLCEVFIEETLPVIPNENGIYEISNAGQLFQFAQLVNIGNSFSGQTVVLTNNIDLANAKWTPIGNWDNAFEGTFDGQGHTISNLYINNPEGEGVGLFGVAADATIKNINIENVNINAYSMVAGVVGAAYPANISDCHISGNVNIVAEWAYVAGISGYCYYGTQVDSCSVVANDGSLIKSATRNGVGGITAWLLEGDHKVTNCTVKNLNLTGWTNVGGITGFVHYNNTIERCYVENVTLTKTRADGNPGIGLIAGGWSYSASNAITLTNNTINTATMEGTHKPYTAYNVLYGSEYGGATTPNFVLENNTTANITNKLLSADTITSSATELDNALQNGQEVILADNVTLDDSETTASSGYKGGTGVSVKGGVLNGNGNTLTVTGANQTWGCAIHTTGGTIKNLTVSGAMRGIFSGGISKDLYIDNVTFKDVIYTFNSDGTKGSCANYGVYISNSTLNGWTSFSDMFKEVVITNCSFGEGSGYAFFRPYGSTEFINCNFAEGYEIDAVGVITFENCTLNGAPLTAENLATLVTSNTANASVK